MEGDWELPWVFIFVYLLLPGTEDIATLYDDKSNNDPNSNIAIGNAMCFFSHIKHCVLKIILNALFELKVKTNMKERCSKD